MASLSPSIVRSTRCHNAHKHRHLWWSTTPIISSTINIIKTLFIIQSLATINWKHGPAKERERERAWAEHISWHTLKSHCRQIGHFSSLKDDSICSKRPSDSFISNESIHRSTTQCIQKHEEFVGSRIPQVRRCVNFEWKWNWKKSIALQTSAEWEKKKTVRWR